MCFYTKKDLTTMLTLRFIHHHENPRCSIPVVNITFIPFPFIMLNVFIDALHLAQGLYLSIGLASWPSHNIMLTLNVNKVICEPPLTGHTIIYWSYYLLVIVIQEKLSWSHVLQ